MGALVTWLALRRPFRVAVQGESMMPTLRPGDFLLAARSGPIRHGALVVVEHLGRPGYEMVKRVAAVPGESVQGNVLAPDQFWLVGDNSAASTDSRTLGPFPRDAIKGRILFRYWPLPRVDRWWAARATQSVRHSP
jgi:nickel-type superoxide dismutase maturation protease